MIRKSTLLIGLLISFCSFAQYDIAVKIDGLGCGDELLLANHFGEKQYLRDTSTCEQGTFHFKGSKSLESGVYLVVLPKKSYFEILISEDEDQMKYTFGIDTGLTLESRVVGGSMENKLFMEFNKVAVVSGRKASKMRQAYDAEEDEKKKEKIKTDMMKITSEVNKERNKIATDYPDLFIAKLYKSVQEVEVAEVPEDMNKDDAAEFKYLQARQHYWDNVDFSEDGLVRSPVFSGKLKRYFDLYMPPIPDTAIYLADDLINRIEKGGSQEQYKYTVHFLLSYFEDSKYLCFDKPLWHMAKYYYCAGKTWWSDSSYVAKMCEESAKMEPVLCNVTAPDMNMPDTLFQKRYRMSEIDKPVTVLIFWDINCGHCKKEMPIISAMYDSMTNKNFEIYAVYTQGDWEGWKKRLAKEKYNFINVANAFGEDDFRKKYNIRSTPQIYVLDKDKKIRFKKIGAADIAKTIQYLLEEQGVVPKEKKKDKS